MKVHVKPPASPPQTKILGGAPAGSMVSAVVGKLEPPTAPQLDSSLYEQSIMLNGATNTFIDNKGSNSKHESAKNSRVI